jgi:two-component system sensor histidine kinase TctE
LTGYGDLRPPSAAAGAFSTFQYRGEEVRSASVARSVTVSGNKQDATVIVAQTRLGLAAISSQISVVAALVGVGFFLLSALLSLLSAQSALAPLDRMRLSVTRRGPGDLRPVEVPTPLELVPLVDALNGLMARLQTSLTQSEEFIAEAAHRVRTPLATVRAQAQMALRRSQQPENKTNLRAMIRAVDESSRSAGQLLDHAMVSFRTDQLAFEQIDLRALVEETVGHLTPTAGLKDIQILQNYEGPLPMQGDSILLQNALRNVLDNAIKYSPEDSIVTVTLSGYTLTFTDQGCGFEADDVGQLTKRFSRGNNVGNIVGSGLGLTIADEVMRAHGGTLILASNSGEEGACVSLVFAP